jgi:hypothetical protein
LGEERRRNKKFGGRERRRWWSRVFFSFPAVLTRFSKRYAGINNNTVPNAGSVPYLGVPERTWAYLGISKTRRFQHNPDFRPFSARLVLFP